MSLVQVVAHKAYLRTNTGNHRVVTARTAARYFGPVLPGEQSPRWAPSGRMQLGIENLTLVPCQVSILHFPMVLQLPPYAAEVVSKRCALFTAPLATVTCRGGLYGAADLYSLTPYVAHPDSYVRTKQQLPAAGGLWRAGTVHYSSGCASLLCLLSMIAVAWRH